MSLLGASAVAFHANGSIDTIKFVCISAIFHLINHATFKGSLFMIAGIVDHETGTRDIRKLGGLMSIMPISFTVAAIGSLSMAGLPPFNGFLSKEMFLTAMLALQSLNSSALKHGEHSSLLLRGLLVFLHLSIVSILFSEHLMGITNQSSYLINHMRRRLVC